MSKAGVSKIGENIKNIGKSSVSLKIYYQKNKFSFSFHTIAKIEAGATPNPTIETLAKIAKTPGVSVDDLIN